MPSLSYRNEESVYAQQNLKAYFTKDMGIKDQIKFGEDGRLKPLNQSQKPRTRFGDLGRTSQSFIAMHRQEKSVSLRRKPI